MQPVMIPAMLRAAGGKPLASDFIIADVDVDWLLANGLGPLAQWITRDLGSLPASVRARIHGEELASVVTTAELLSLVEHTLALLREAGIECTLLKGISYALRYYPKPHLRVMGDVDLLVDAGELQGAESVLLANGFELPDNAPPETWSSHHHGPPLKHSASGITVELHTRLLPPFPRAAGHDALSMERIGAHRSQQAVGGETARVFHAEFEALLIAAGWCTDLGGMFASSGLQRPLFDMVRIIDTRAGSLDWDLIVELVSGTFTAPCLGVLLSYLDRHDALHAPADVVPRILGTQAFVSRRSCNAIHALLDRHLIVRRRSRGLLSPYRVGRILGAFLTPRPSWRNWLTVPGAILFPSAAGTRFGLGDQPRRLGSGFRASQR